MSPRFRAPITLISRQLVPPALTTRYDRVRRVGARADRDSVAHRAIAQELLRHPPVRSGPHRERRIGGGRLRGLAHGQRRQLLALARDGASLRAACLMTQPECARLNVRRNRGRAPAAAALGADRPPEVIQRCRMAIRSDATGAGTELCSSGRVLPPGYHAVRPIARRFAISPSGLGQGR